MLVEFWMLTAGDTWERVSTELCVSTIDDNGLVLQPLCLAFIHKYGTSAGPI